MTAPTDAAALLRAVLAARGDETPRLVFADYLDELGGAYNAAWATYLRLKTNAFAGGAPRVERQAELMRAAADIRARLTMPAVAFLTHLDTVLQLLPAANVTVKLDGFQVPVVILMNAPEGVCREFQVLPIAWSGYRGPDLPAVNWTHRTFVFAGADPKEPELNQRLGFVLNCDVIVVAAEPADIWEAIHRHYTTAEMQAVIEHTTTFGGPDYFEMAEAIAAEGVDGNDVFSRLAALILNEAISVGALAIRIEPTAAGGQVRYRLDGEWEDRDVLPSRVLQPLAARFRRMAGLAADDRPGVNLGLMRLHYRGRDHILPLDVTDTPAGPDVWVQLPAATGRG